jgi:FixJ family two-component response regulator
MCDSPEEGRRVSIRPPIAVIDDDERFRTALIESLCSFGYDVRGFGSAEEFVAAGEPGSYGCLITDVHMPGMSGIELKRLLVARDCLVPVIMITGRAESGIETKAAASGAVCLLTKPFQTGALINSLESAVRS